MDYNSYYRNIEVLFEIVKLMPGKEVAFLGKDYNVRCIKVHSFNYLMSNFNSFNFFKREYNIYISSANYKDMPCFSYNPKERRLQQDSFNKDYKNYMMGYDFFIDIDGDPSDHLPAYEEAKKIKMLFDRYKLPYVLKFSGKGFHFHILSEFFDNYPDYMERNNVFKNLAVSLVKVLNLKLIDLSVYDLRRVYKVAYSLDVKTGRVALPLTDEQFENFNIKMVLPEEVLKNGLRNRGLMMRQGSSVNIKRFFEDYL